MKKTNKVTMHGELMYKTDKTILNVPEEQENWLFANYETLFAELEETSSIFAKSFLLNLTGAVNTVVNYKGGHPTKGFIDGLVEDFIFEYNDKKDKISFIQDILLCILEDCKEFKELELYELANNLQVIIEAFEKSIDFQDKGINLCTSTIIEINKQ